MRAQFKLSHKGLLLVCTLLVFELVLLTLLFTMLREAELEAQRYEHSNAVMAKASGILKILMDTGTSLAAYAMLQTPSLGERYDNTVATIPKEVADLRELLRGEDLASQAKVDRIDDLLTTGVGKLTAYKHKIESSGDISATVLRREMQGPFTKLLKEFREFTDDIKQQASKASPDTARNIRKQVQVVLLVGIFVNIFAGIGLMRLFITGITRKLDVLHDNTVRLASGVELNKPIGGEDEIGHLDSVFHYMANALVESSKKEKEATETAQASEERVRAIIENMPLGLIAIENDGRIQSINQRGEEIFGYTQAELVGKHIGELFAEKLGDAPLAFVDRIKQASAKGVFEIDSKRKNGELFPAELALNDFESRDGNLLLVNVQDVTERHEVEQLKREFVAMVSHDLRTPLTSVHGSLTLLAAGALGDLSSDAQEVVTTAETEVERLTNLVNDLLDVARIEAGKLEVHIEEIDLMPIIKRSVSSLNNFADRHKVKVETEETNLRVMADSDRMVQVVVNLLSNAIKFSNVGSKVSICISEVDQWAEVRVLDHGRGIPEEHLEAVFQRYHQVESADATQKRGTGLGLPICKTIVEDHGGSIGVESEVGKGSTFWFRLKKAPVASAV